MSSQKWATVILILFGIVLTIIGWVELDWNRIKNFLIGASRIIDILLFIAGIVILLDISEKKENDEAY